MQNKRSIDTKRCRYSDCPEQHPVASGHEQITCPICRKYLGLSPLTPKGTIPVRRSK